MSNDVTMASRFDQLRLWFEVRMEELGIPGASLGVFHGDFVEATGVGVCDISTGIPVTTHTAFRVASLTKLLTASALVAVSNDTDLRLDAPIASWYPDFALADSQLAARVTVEQLLSHSAGWADTPWPEEENSTATLAEVASEVASSVQVASPGALFNYSNSSFLVAGHMLAIATGLTYEESIAKILLQPLGMSHSGFTHVDLGQTPLSPGHTFGEDGLEPADLWENPASVNPAGGLLATVDDLLRFVRFHSGVLAEDHVPMNEAQRLTMQEPHGPGGSLGPTVADAIGLGWMLTKAGDHRVAMSFGSDSGAAAGMAVVADAGFGVVVLTNADPGLLLATETLSRALDIFLEVSAKTVTSAAISADDLQAVAGRYEIPGDFAFDIEVVDGKVTITAYAGEQMIPDISGPLTMISPAIGSITVQGMPVLIDFVRSEDGVVGWIRSFARLAPRTR